MKQGWIKPIFILILAFPMAAAAMEIQPARGKENVERSVVLQEDKAAGNHKPSLQNISIRATFSSSDVIGKVAPEEFREYDLAATFRLPWSRYSATGWGVGTGLMVGLGALCSSGEAGLALSLLPLAVFGHRDGGVSLDLGAGGAALSRYQFGEQDFGSPFQFALTAGLSVPIFRHVGVGYRFLHYSDAGLNGADTTGADLHMVELLYLF
ncbi:MAG: acyloxyacyl hydrolase [Desulfobacteraceae bacterium]|nr:acyloxyacyl hydrolase [Desulfobacteraceae bacterium]